MVKKNFEKTLLECELNSYRQRNQSINLLQLRFRIFEVQNL